MAMPTPPLFRYHEEVWRQYAPTKKGMEQACLRATKHCKMAAMKHVFPKLLRPDGQSPLLEGNLRSATASTAPSPVSRLRLLIL